MAFRRRVRERAKAATEDERQFVILHLGEQEFALPILGVREIIAVPRVTPIPDAPSFVEGVTNLRGEIIPVVDLAQRIGRAVLPAEDPAGRRAADAASRRIVITEVSGHTAGLIVDRVTRIERVPASRVADAPAIVQGLDRRYVAGVVSLGEPVRLIVVIDIGKVLRPEEQEAMGNF